MKKVIILLLIISTFVALTALKENKANFRLISTKKIVPIQYNSKSDILPKYTIESAYGDSVYLEGVGEPILIETLIWKNGDQIVSQYPQEKYEENTPVIWFIDICFSTVSNLWIIQYEYRNPEHYQGINKESGILYFTEDGKTLVKDLKTPLLNNGSFYFNKVVKDISDDTIGAYTEADAFFSFPYFISVYGEILYTFPLTYEMQYVSFSEDGRFFYFYDNIIELDYIYSVHNSELLLNGLEDRIKYFNVSSDRQFCALADRNRGNIAIYQVDPVTKRATKYFETRIWNFPGVPYTTQTRIDDSGSKVAYFNIKVRFQEGTNYLIITTDDLYESVVEVNFED
jgi:hypothetical protein